MPALFPPLQVSCRIQASLPSPTGSSMAQCPLFRVSLRIVLNVMAIGEIVTCHPIKGHPIKGHPINNKQVLSRSPGVHKNPGLLTVLLLRRREGCGFLYRPVMPGSTKAGKSTLSNYIRRVQRSGKLLQYLQRHYRAIGLLVRSPPMYPALFERYRQHPMDCKHRDLGQTRNLQH